MDCSESNSSFYVAEVMAPIVVFQKVRCVQLIFQFPCVVSLRISFPFEEILESFVLPEMAVASDGFYFVLRFAIDEVRWGPCEVGAMGICFDVWG
jgi:hypothetical protein